MSYSYNEKNIVDILNLTVAEAIPFFSEHSKISKHLQALNKVGLSYLSLGQPLSTLSGGERQRIKLAKYLNQKGNVYVLDEPTTGLHASDVKSIMKLLENLVEKGNTVIVIEHNIEDNGYEICGNIRESYIDGVWNKESCKEWLSEIQIPVCKKK